MTTEPDPHSTSALYTEADKIAVLIELYGRECLRVLRLMTRPGDLTSQIALGRGLLRHLHEATGKAIKE